MAEKPYKLQPLISEIMKNKETLIIFDFDNTLFKTREFWREYLFPFYARIGIPKNLTENAFAGATTGQVDYFVPKLFIDELYRRVKKGKICAKKQLRDIFEERVYSKAVRKYFYPHSLELIEKAGRKYKKLLISYGDQRFKEKFFKHCGLDKYFSPKEIIITNRPKLKVFKKMAIPAECIIIDDIYPEIIRLSAFLRRKGAATKGFLINRKKNLKIKEKNIIICKSLAEISQKI